MYSHYWYQNVDKFCRSSCLTIIIANHLLVSTFRDHETEMKLPLKRWVIIIITAARHGIFADHILYLYRAVWELPEECKTSSANQSYRRFYKTKHINCPRVVRCTAALQQNESYVILTCPSRLSVELSGTLFITDGLSQACALNAALQCCWLFRIFTLFFTSTVFCLRPLLFVKLSHCSFRYPRVFDVPLFYQISDFSLFSSEFIV